MLLCMGLFSIFLVGSDADRKPQPEGPLTRSVRPLSRSSRGRAGVRVLRGHRLCGGHPHPPRFARRPPPQAGEVQWCPPRVPRKFYHNVATRSVCPSPALRGGGLGWGCFSITSRAVQEPSRRRIASGDCRSTPPHAAGSATASALASRWVSAL